MNEIQVTVRFAETDALGHVNNSSYFIYLEEARIRFVEMLGQSMDMSEWNLILASAKCDFMSQGYFNQKLTIKTFVTNIGTKSFQLEHEICASETGKMIAKGYGAMVCFNFATQASEPLPDLLKEGLKQYLVHA